MASAIQSQAEKTPWDYTYEFFGGTIVPVVFEIQRLLPDSLLFGTLAMFIFTGNTTWGVLLTFLVEILVAHGLLAAGFQAYQGPQKAMGPLSCRPGFRHPRFDFTRFFIRDRYPSVSTFSLSAIATYFGLTINYFAETLRAMGPEWAARVTVAYIFIALFVVSILSTRLLYGCESKSELLVALIAGLLISVLLFSINFALFGAEGINILGLPMLVDKTKEGNPIYICTKQGGL
jgi:hypothetical protein